MAETIIAQNQATTNGTRGSQHTATVTTKYTKRADDDGWLVVLLSAEKIKVGISEYTKVILTKEKGSRIFFNIADGNSEYVGKEASLEKENAARYLVDTPPPNGTALMTVKYNGSPIMTYSPIRRDSNRQQWGKLSFNGTTAAVTLNSDWTGKYTPIPAGKHRIMAPDRSHQNEPTAGYRAAHPGQIRCTDVWFPIELQGTTGNSSRYVHIGHLSHGCVTVYELLKWNLVYDYLISRRIPKTNGKYVGDLVVEK